MLQCSPAAVVLQGIIFTAGTMWNFLQKINVPIHVQEVSLHATAYDSTMASLSFHMVNCFLGIKTRTM
jgi:hypothetical protein